MSDISTEDNTSHYVEKKSLDWMTRFVIRDSEH